MDYINIVIFGCAVVTFIPRLIPALFIDRLNFSPKFEKFLNLIPYTALAALICPGAKTCPTFAFGRKPTLTPDLSVWSPGPALPTTERRRKTLTKEKWKDFRPARRKPIPTQSNSINRYVSRQEIAVKQNFCYRRQS